MFVVKLQGTKGQEGDALIGPPGMPGALGIPGMPGMLGDDGEPGTVNI